MQRARVLTREILGRATILKLDLSALSQAAAQLAHLCCSADTEPQLTDKGSDA
jgi:hypothetical protein